VVLALAPYDLSIAGRVDVEEGFLFALIALSYAILLTTDGFLSALAAGLVIATIYLTKSSMLALCLAMTVWIVINHWRRKPGIILIPIVSLALAIASWGTYIEAVSGVFAVGAGASSWNGWNFYKGNNQYAVSLYPRVNLDILDHEEYAHKLLPFVPVHNEWELSHAQLALGKRYVQDNPRAIVKIDLKKLFVACCDLKQSPEFSPGHTRKAVILGNVVNHLTLLCVFVVAVINLIRRQASGAEILAVVLTAVYVLPYFAGFLYARHMVPVYGLAALTAAVQLTHWRGRVLSRRLFGSPGAVIDC
jgi:hypothetical protein